MSLPSWLSSLGASFLDHLGFGARHIDEDFGQRSRPSLPPVFFLAVSLWASAALSYECLCVIDRSWHLPLLLLASGGAVIGIILLVRAGCPANALCLLIGASLGLGLAQMQASTMKQDEPFELTGRFLLQTDVTNGTFGAYAQGLAESSDGRLIKTRILFDETNTFLAGDQIEARFSCTPTCYPSSDLTQLTSCDEDLLKSWRQGIRAETRLRSCELIEGQGVAGAVRDLRRKAIEVLDPAAAEERSFLAAVLFGNRSEFFESELYQCLKVDGLAHLAAVSGAHLSIVTALLTLVLARLPLNPWARCVVLIGAVGVYLALTGFPISALRAALMVILSLSSVLAHRRSYALGALSLGIIVLVATDPLCAGSLSFILSVQSTLGIILFGGLVTQWVKRLIAHVPAFIAESIGVTIASSLLTLPISASCFSQISLIAPLANLIATPCFTLLCPLGLALIFLTLIAPWMSSCLLVLDGFTSLVALVFTALARIPHASVPSSISMPTALIGGISLCLLLWLWWPQPSPRRPRSRRRRILQIEMALTLLLALGFWSNASSLSDEIIMLDVGQGDAFILRSRGQTLLIDTGNEDQALLESFAQHQITRLDGLLITHADDDHCGAMESLQGVVPVDEVFLSSLCSKSDDEGDRELIGASERLVGKEKVSYIQPGSKLSWGVFQGEVIAPSERQEGSRNETSLVLSVSWDLDSDGREEGKGLFCGDAEAESLKQALESTDLSSVSIYKVGHHGSKAALDEELACRLKPQVALVSVGADNRYGHPRAETLELLERQGSLICRSDEQGDVSCHLTTDGIRITTERNS